MSFDYGWNYCPDCYQQFQNQEHPELPPCMKSESLGFCGVLGVERINDIPVGPLVLDPLAQLAVTIYHKAVALSGHDVAGLPTITNLALALELTPLELDYDDIERLTQLVIHISLRVRDHLSKKKETPPPE